MPASVRFACNLIAEPELLRNGDGKPFAGFCVEIERRIDIETGERVDGEHTRHSVTNGTAINHVDHSTERVASLATRFGEVGKSLKYDGAHLERQTALAVTTEI